MSSIPDKLAPPQICTIIVLRYIEEIQYQSAHHWEINQAFFRGAVAPMVESNSSVQDKLFSKEIF